MHPAETFAEPTALGDIGATGRQAFKEGNDHRVAALEHAQGGAVLADDRLGARIALGGKVLFQADEIGQVVRLTRFSNRVRI